MLGQIYLYKGFYGLERIKKYNLIIVKVKRYYKISKKFICTILSFINNVEISKN